MSEEKKQKEVREGRSSTDKVLGNDEKFHKDAMDLSPEAEERQLQRLRDFNSRRQAKNEEKK